MATMATTQTLTGLHLRKRFLAAFSTTPVKQLNKLKVEAEQSLLELESLYLIKLLPLHQLVAFYAIVSPWCDMSPKLYQLERALARIDYGRYLKARVALVAIAAREERDPYGVNRTSQGQIPSMETTFLGNRRGAQSFSYWERHRHLLAAEPAIDSPTIMELIDAQASELLDNGIGRWTLFLQNLIDS